MTYQSPHCLSCGDPIGYNPRAQPYWNKSGRKGEVPGAGWFHETIPHKMDEHGEDIPGTGIYSRMKSDPDFHYAVPAADLHGPTVALAKQAHMDQMRMHVERHLSRQFDYLAARDRGGTHIDLAED